MVFTTTHIGARVKPSTALPHDDVTGTNDFATVSFNA
jgi:hypothetical protein